MKPSSIIGFAILAVVFSTQATAGFRCGYNDIVNKGDSKAKVRVTCGEPEYKDTDVGAGSEILKESWTYRDYSDSHWMTILHFTRGKITRIESLGRVD